MLTLPASVRVFVARGATDLRRSFDRLSAQVQEVLRQDPFSGHLFAFFNRRRDRVKLLVWERGGFWLLYKRLETGTFADVERAEITARDLFLLLASDLGERGDRERLALGRLRHGQVARPVHLSASVDGLKLATYVADGLIASTATGSGMSGARAIRSTTMAAASA